MVKVDTDEDDFRPRRHASSRPEGGRHDSQIWTGLLPSVGDPEISINPAIPLGTHQASTGTEGGKQALSIKGAVSAENDGGNAIFFGFGCVRVGQLFSVAVISRGSGGIIQVSIENKPRVDGPIRDNHNTGTGIHSANGCDNPLGLGGINDIGFGNEDEVSELDLVDEKVRHGAVIAGRSIDTLGGKALATAQLVKKGGRVYEGDQVSMGATSASVVPSANSHSKVAATGIGSEMPVDSMTI